MDGCSFSVGCDGGASCCHAGRAEAILDRAEPDLSDWVDAAVEVMKDTTKSEVDAAREVLGDFCSAKNPGQLRPTCADSAHAHGPS